MIDTRYDKTRICAFAYFWYKSLTDEHWDVGAGGNLYDPTGGKYISNSQNQYRRMTVEARKAGIDSFACSNWYGGPWYSAATDDAFKSESNFRQYLTWLESPANPHPEFQIFIYWELDDAAPTAAQFLNLLQYHRSKFSSRNYMKRRAIKKTDGTTYIDNAPVFFIYSNDAVTRGNYTDGVKLYEAAYPGETIYLGLEIHTAWTDFADRAIVDCWHKYAPWGDEQYIHSTSWIHVGGGATPTSYSAYDSITLSPGGESASDDGATASLARSAAEYITAWNTVLTLLAAAPANTGPDFIFICSWNEWGEASSIEPSPDWADGLDGYTDGIYLSITYAYAILIAASQGSRLTKTDNFNIRDGGGVHGYQLL